MPNYKRIVPRPPELDGNTISRMYVNGDGNLVVVYSSGQITTLTGLSGGTPPTTGLDGGFAVYDHIIEIDAGDSSYIGSTPANGGGAYNSL